MDLAAGRGGARPGEVLSRRKHGFDIPLRAWTLGTLRPAITAAIAEAPTTVFDRAALAALWNDHVADAADHAELFWAFLVFDRWRRRHAIPLT